MLEEDWVAISTFCDRFINVPVSKATGNSVLFPGEENALLQALLRFHVNLCPLQDWGTPRVKQKFISIEGDKMPSKLNQSIPDSEMLTIIRIFQIKCIYSDQCWLNPDLTHFFSQILDTPLHFI